MGQILYEPPDVAGWDAGPVVVLDRRDAGADEFRVDARRQPEVQPGDGGEAGDAQTPDALLVVRRSTRWRHAPLDADGDGGAVELPARHRRVDRQRRAAAGEGAGLVHLIAGSPEYQLV